MFLFRFYLVKSNVSIIKYYYIIIIIYRFILCSLKLLYSEIIDLELKLNKERDF